MPMPSLIDQRRLRDGAEALRTDEPPEGVGVLTLEVYKTGLGSAIAAMQSLEDLGPEANQRAYDDEQALWVRYRRAEERIKLLKEAAAT